MTLADLDIAQILLRSAVYVATIAMAGGVVFFATVPGADRLAGAVRWQIWLGAGLLLVVEPLRYVQFQLAISGGDWALAFDPSMRWMAIETPIGQAALVRVVSALVIVIVIVISGLRVWPLSVVAAAMIGSYALEGHTASHEGDGWLPSVLIFIHLALAHWWLGALYPLYCATRTMQDRDLTDLVARFASRALAAVALLTSAGILLIAMLAGWQFDPARSHQLALGAKLAVFATILVIAALNKLRWTPMLVTAPEHGRIGLRRSLGWEIASCALILIATAIMTSFPPAPD